MSFRQTVLTVNSSHWSLQGLNCSLAFWPNIWARTKLPASPPEYKPYPRIRFVFLILGWLDITIVQEEQKKPLDAEGVGISARNASQPGASVKSLGIAGAGQASPAFSIPWLLHALCGFYRPFRTSHLEQPLTGMLSPNLLKTRYLRRWSCLPSLHHLRIQRKLWFLLCWSLSSSWRSSSCWLQAKSHHKRLTSSNWWVNFEVCLTVLWKSHRFYSSPSRFCIWERK